MYETYRESIIDTYIKKNSASERKKERCLRSWVRKDLEKIYNIIINLNVETVR